ncbi:MAG: family transporter substrate-binding protein, partial [Acidimicrobiaceae bacterium]|nr:family transporter substrate-binding protein [Acidimicrobiaceae bacterium]
MHRPIPRTIRNRFRRKLAKVMAVGLSTLTVAGLGAFDPSGASAAPRAKIHAEPWKGATKIGFIMVGEESDQGYNQAVYMSAKATAAALKATAVYAANVPETTQVTATMQAMVNAGVKVIFATSYGYYQFALAFAKSHPNVVVLHQAG